MPKVTATDVARRAGVSQPTVSLVMSGNPRARVSDATRARVLQAAEELGYRPNIVARSLVMRRSYALGVLVPDFGNPIVAEVVGGVERVASQEGYAVLLCDARETTVERHLEALRGRMVDGVILDALGVASVPPEELRGLNVVLIGEQSEQWPGVVSDAPAAGRLAAQHLLSLGHRDFAFIGPVTDIHVFRMRERGYVAALREAGISIPSAWLRRAPATVSGGQAAMRALLQQESRPSAVFCANDLIALGALKAALAAGVSVPGELSLVGCDDIEMARVVTPELTTITVPARELGARAARLLLRRIADPNAELRIPKPLPVTLAVRGTTAIAPPSR